MTDRYPYPEIRTNDTIRRLALETEAGFSRSEYQQVVYCAGEANPDEPIWFGRAYDRPPFFSFSAVSKSNEVVVTANPCGDITDRASGMTIGVEKWIRDEQGMYVGAHLWYKVAKAEIDRSGGFGWIDHVYVENTKIVPLPECVKTSDCLWLFVAGGGPLTPDVDVVSPNMGTKFIHNMGLTTGETYQNGSWRNTYHPGNFEPVGNVVTLLNTCDWAVMAAIRGTGCRLTVGGGGTSTGTSLFPDQSGPPLDFRFGPANIFSDYSPSFLAGAVNYGAAFPYGLGYPDRPDGEPFSPSRDVMISVIQDINNFASSNGVTFHNVERYGLRLLEPGPLLTGSPGKASRIFYGEGNNLIAPNEDAHRPDGSPTPDPGGFGRGWGVPIHESIPALKLAKWDHPMVSFDPPAETSYFYSRIRIY